MAINCFGDSITAGVGTGADTWYSQIIGSLLNQTANNYGINGSQLVDQMQSIYSAPSLDSLFLTGFNDERYWGSVYMNNYTAPVDAAVVWLTSGNKVKAQSSSISYVGSWVNAGAYGGSLTKLSTALGDTATCTMSGTCIYIGATRINGGTGTFTVTVDGVSYGWTACYGNGVPFSGLTYGPLLVRIAGLSDTEHTIVIENTSGGQVYIDYIANNEPGNTLVLGQCLKCTDYNYTLGAPAPYFTQGSDATVDAYNAYINSMVLYANDGLDVRIAPMKYDPYTQSVSGNVHPTTAGQCNIALCFLNVYKPDWQNS